MQGSDSETEDEDMEEIKEADLFRPDGDAHSRDPDPEDESNANTPSDASSDERHKLANQVLDYLVS